MKKITVLVCAFFMTFTLFAQNYGNTVRQGLTAIKHSLQDADNDTHNASKKVNPESKTDKMNKDEIALVVSGEGQTKVEATASALRSAIEQAFGTFVSANTTLLNDDIVRNEIATVASGNIKSYKELSSFQNADGLYNVSVSAVVSIGKLISYAQSHGSSAEFAGQTFMMNIKMRELNKQNEYEALQNMVVQLRSLQDDIFDYEIKALDPTQDKNGDWEVPVKLFTKTNQNYCSFIELIDNTVSSLSLSIKEWKAYKDNNMGYTVFTPFGVGRDHSSEASVKIGKYAILRNDKSIIRNIANEIIKILTDAQKSCLIKTIPGKIQVRFPKNPDTQIYEFDGLNIYPFYKSSSIPRTANIIFAKQTFKFKLSLEELGQLQGFEVVKAPIPDSNIERFIATADNTGFPYSLEGNIMIIKTEKHIYHLDIENESVKIYDNEGRFIHSSGMDTGRVYNYYDSFHYESLSSANGKIKGEIPLHDYYYDLHPYYRFPEDILEITANNIRLTFTKSSCHFKGTFSAYEKYIFE